MSKLDDLIEKLYGKPPAQEARTGMEAKNIYFDSQKRTTQKYFAWMIVEALKGEILVPLNKLCGRPDDVVAILNIIDLAYEALRKEE